jgi:general secretion pathway protein E
MNVAGEQSGESLDDALLQKGRSLARLSGRSLLSELAALTASEPRQLVDALARRFQLLVMDTTEMLACGTAFDLLPMVKAQQRGCVLLRSLPSSGEGAETHLIAVIADPFDSDCMVWLSSLAAAPLHYCLALAADIQAYLSKHEESLHAVQSLVHDSASSAENSRSAEVLSFASLSEASSPAVKLVNSTVYDAVRAAASDVHLESTPTGITIKYRLDGVLDSGRADQWRGPRRASGVAPESARRTRYRRAANATGRQLSSSGGRPRHRPAGVDHAEHSRRGCGRAHPRQAWRDRGAWIADAGPAGLRRALSLKALRRLVEEPYGMLLVTGPTGSGKTTTLYGAISEINSGRDKIITIEDPVEYQLSGVLQIPGQRQERPDLSRAACARFCATIPDKIMIGEIRDRETAEIAVQSALTGHLVLTTVHANNVFDVFGRFTHMGIDPYAFASALNGIWAQRLLRVNCARCSEAYTPGEAELERFVDRRRRAGGFRFPPRQRLRRLSR